MVTSSWHPLPTVLAQLGDPRTTQLKPRINAFDPGIAIDESSLRIVGGVNVQPYSAWHGRSSASGAQVAQCVLALGADACQGLTLMVSPVVY